jgi:curved DNA-binding protein CbpA
LKESFHRASAAWHPDVAGSGDAARFAAASAAYSALRDPGSRLRHLLELDAPELLTRSAAIPPELADLFMRLAEFRQALDAFQKKENVAASGLARALLASDRQTLWQRANALHVDLAAAHDAALVQLRTLDAHWSPQAASAVEHLAALQQRFAYLSKWRAQLGESLFQLQS